MEDRSLLRDVVLQDVQDVLSGLSVVDDDRKMSPSCNLKVLEEHIHLDVLVLLVLAVVQTCLSDGDDAVKLQELLDLRLPARDLVSALGRGDSNGMENVLCALEVVVDDLEVREAVADGDDM